MSNCKYPLPLNKFNGGDTKQPNQAIGERFIKINEVAEMLGVSVVAVRTLVSRNKLPSYKPFRELLFKKSEILNLIEKSKRGASYGY